MAIKKSLVVTFLILLLTAVLLSDVVHAEDGIELEAESAILIEANTGKILFEKQSDVALHPASMSKMMSEYLILEAVNNGKIAWDQEINISEYAFEVSQNSELSNVPLRIDETYNIKELYEAMAIYSANGATIALAEFVAGSELNFVQMMNNKAKEMQLTEFKFVNSTGLNNSDLYGNYSVGTETEENVMSARDTAKLAYHLIRDYPEVLDTASIAKKTFKEGTDDAINMSNWNWMLPELVYGYEGVDGIKTGSTNLAGYSFASTAERDGMRLISVVMKTDSYEARFEQTRQLLDYGFNNFKEKELFPANYEIKGLSELPVIKGEEKTVGVATNKPIVTVVKVGEEDSYEVEYELKKDLLTENGELIAGVNKGEKVGTMRINYSGVESGYIAADSNDSEKVDLVTTSSVEKGNWFILLVSSVGGFFSDVFTTTQDSIKGML